jgi:hypothetical protein
LSTRLVYHAWRHWGLGEFSTNGRSPDCAARPRYEGRED